MTIDSGSTGALNRNSARSREPTGSTWWVGLSHPVPSFRLRTPRPDEDWPSWEVSNVVPLPPVSDHAVAVAVTPAAVNVRTLPQPEPLLVPPDVKLQVTTAASATAAMALMPPASAKGAIRVRPLPAHDGLFPARLASARLGGRAFAR